MTNWRPIGSVPNDQRKLTVRRVVHGQTVYEDTAIWRPDIGEWIDAIEMEIRYSNSVLYRICDWLSCKRLPLARWNCPAFS